jgi:hypothetical protein
MTARLVKTRPRGNLYVTFGPDALALRRIERGGHEKCHADPNRWHECPRSLRVRRHEAPNSRRHPNGQHWARLTAGHHRNLQLDETFESSVFFVGACGALPYGVHVYGHRLGIGVDLNDGDLGAVGVGVFVECDEPRSLSLKELNQPRDTDTLSIDGARCPA